MTTTQSLQSGLSIGTELIEWVFISKRFIRLPYRIWSGSSIMLVLYSRGWQSNSSSPVHEVRHLSSPDLGQDFWSISGELLVVSSHWKLEGLQCTHREAEEIGSNISDRIRRGSNRVDMRGVLVKRRENLSVSHVLSPSCYQKGAHKFVVSLPTSVKAIKTVPHKVAHSPT